MNQTSETQPADEKPKKKRATAADKRRTLLTKLREREEQRGKKALSREQQLALHIADMPERGQKDEAMLRTILDAERAAILARQKKAKAAKIYQDATEKERRARTRRLIELGGLADLAGVGEYDKATLLGVLASIPEMAEHELEHMHQRGSDIFAEREAAKAAEKARKEEEKARKEAEKATPEPEPLRDRYGNAIDQNGNIIRE